MRLMTSRLCDIIGCPDLENKKNKSSIGPVMGMFSKPIIFHFIEIHVTFVAHTQNFNNFYRTITEISAIFHFYPTHLKMEIEWGTHTEYRSVQSLYFRVNH